jgi:hypothetical protein
VIGFEAGLSKVENLKLELVIGIHVQTVPSSKQTLICAALLSLSSVLGGRAPRSMLRPGIN